MKGLNEPGASEIDRINDNQSVKGNAKGGIPWQ